MRYYLRHLERILYRTQACQRKGPTGLFKWVRPALFLIHAAPPFGAQIWDFMLAMVKDDPDSFRQARLHGLGENVRLQYSRSHRRGTERALIELNALVSVMPLGEQQTNAALVDDLQWSAQDKAHLLACELHSASERQVVTHKYTGTRNVACWDVLS